MTLLLLFKSTVEEAPTEVITVPVYGGVRRRQHPSRKLSQQYMCRMLRAYCRIKDDEEIKLYGKLEHTVKLSAHAPIVMFESIKNMGRIINESKIKIKSKITDITRITTHGRLETMKEIRCVAHVKNPLLRDISEYCEMLESI